MMDAGDTQALMAFLKSELQTLEAAAGAEDDEARQLLKQLEQQTAVLQSMSVQPAEQQPVLSELQLAEQLDNLDLQLSQLEASLAAADAPTLELLGQSTSRWMQAAHATANPSAAAHQDVPALSQSDVQCEAQQLGSSGTHGVHMNGTTSSSSQPLTSDDGTSSRQHDSEAKQIAVEGSPGNSSPAAELSTGGAGSGADQQPTAAGSESGSSKQQTSSTEAAPAQ